MTVAENVKGCQCVEADMFRLSSFFAILWSMNETEWCVLCTMEKSALSFVVLVRFDLKMDLEAPIPIKTRYRYRNSSSADYGTNLDFSPFIARHYYAIRRTSIYVCFYLRHHQTLLQTYSEMLDMVVGFTVTKFGRP
jgi:hypothetical protein